MRGEEMKWTKIEERIPTKEEREDSVIAWWHIDECTAFIGEYSCYDGRWIQFGEKHWHMQIALCKFSHWAILEKPEGVE